MSRCEICKFSRQNGSAFECRKYPPPWYAVGKDDWCGQWEMMSLSPPLQGSSLTKERNLSVAQVEKLYKDRG